MSEQTVPQTGLSDNAASGLAYVTIIPAIVFLATAPYNQNQKIRFHAWQSIFLHIAAVILWMAVIVVGMVPVLNLIDIVLAPLAMLGFFILWIVLLIQVFNGKNFKLPIIGDLAQKQAGGAAL